MDERRTEARLRPGVRIRLRHVADEHTHLKPGDLGTVTRATRDPWGVVVDVVWDCGSTLSLIPGTDLWEVVDTPAPDPVGSTATQDAPTMSAPTQQPSGPELTLAARLWDEAMCEALAKRGLVATPHDGSGALVFPRESVEQLIVMLPLQPAESAARRQQPSG